MKGKSKLLAMLLALMMLCSAIASPLMSVTAAVADLVPGTKYMIVSKKSGLAITPENYSTEVGAGLVQMPAKGYESQVWRLDGSGENGYYYLVNAASNTAIGVPNNSTANDTQIAQLSRGGDSRKWAITDATNGYVRITPKLNANLGLNVAGASNAEGAKIIQWNWGGADNEQWSLVAVAEADIKENPSFDIDDAATAIDAYIDAFFYVENGLGKLKNEPSNGFWTDAEILEVFIDAYERFGDAKYLTVAEQFYDGIIDRRDESWAWNDFNDDVMWMVIATARLYLLTENEEYLTVAKANFDMCYNRAWDTTFMGGGLWWTTDNNSKNACVNGPGAIAACLLGDATGDKGYYDKAQAIIDWEAANFLQNSGAIWDSFNVNGSHSDWASTYNQGTFIGACAMLYNYTDNAKYLQWATSAADYAATMGDAPEGYLNREPNTGDLIGFKGILGRWLGYFARECKVTTYNEWMYKNAEAAWNNRNSDDLMWTQFGKQTEEDLQNSETIFNTQDNVAVKTYAAWGASAAVSWLVNTPVDAEAWTVTSPDGNTEMTITLGTDGSLSYTAMQDNVTVVKESKMGITTSLDDFTKGLSFAGKTDTVIDEEYNVISGKADTYVNKANQTTLTLTSAKGIRFDIIARAYDDGIAFRYVITTDNGQAMTIQPNAEITGFNLPNGSQMWYMPRGGELFDDPDNNGGTSYMYEYTYQSSTIGDVVDGIQPTMPMLYETQGKYGLIMEADRHGNYVGSLLRLENGSELRTIFDLVQTTAVETTAPFTSPWRTVIIGSAADIMENTMVENLSPAPDEQYDFESWVAPGMSSWSWVSYYGGQEDPEIHKYFIDLAADMGWEYYILDEGWQPGTGNYNGNDITTSRYKGMWNWFDEVRDYANEKGVKLFAWVHMSDVDTDAEREARFKEWSEAGIVGIKVDFFYNESQERLQLHDDIYADAAKYHLMVNVHGSNPPSGEIRTYPNVITREAIKGQEAGGITVQQYTLIPFIRAAVGSADVTEQLYSREQNKTTMGFQIALSTLIQNGLHSMGSKPDEYYSIPAAVSYYTNFPTKWDDMYVMEDITTVGEEVNLARKSGDAWYAAGISVDAANYDIQPNFLDVGKTYTAIIYKEVAGQRQNIEMQVINNVTSTTDLPTIAVQAGGGYAIKFIPEDDTLQSITAPSANVTVNVLGTQNVKIAFAPEETIATDVVWKIADETVATITATTGTGVIIKGLKVGTTTATATSAYDATKQAVVNVTVKNGKYIFDDTTWTVFENNHNYVIDGDDSVTITAENGVVDHNIFAMEATDENFEITAKISGGLNANYQGGFIGVFDADQNPYVSVGRRYHTMFTQNNSNNLISVMSNASEQYAADPNANGDVYVRLVKNGDDFTGYYRVNETDDWTQAFTVTNAALADVEPMYVGFYAGCGGTNNGIDITISEFTYQGEAVKVAAVNPDYYVASEKLEAEKAVLANGAVVATNAEASNGAHAGNIGANNGAGSATFTATTPYAGQATIKAYYIAGGTRDFNITVNGVTTTVTVANNGSWTAVVAEPITLNVDFVAGDNTIVFSGNNGYAPNLDYIEVIYPEAPVVPEPEPEPVNPGDLAVGNSYEMELGTLAGGAAVVREDSTANASGGADVGNIGGANNGTVSFTLESDVDGTATLNLYYGTWNDRSISVTVNGTVYPVDCPATGNWHQIGDPITVEVKVKKGENTIVFGGVDGGNAPNLDKFTVTALVEDMPEPEPVIEKAVFKADSATAPANARVRVPLHLTNADALLAATADGLLGGIQLGLTYSDQLTLTDFIATDLFTGYNAYAQQLESGRGKIMNFALSVDPVEIADITDDTIIGYIEFATSAEFETTDVNITVEAVCDAGQENNGFAVIYNAYIDTAAPFEIAKAEVAELKFSTSAVVLQNSLKVQFKANKALFEETGYANPYVIFEFNGELITSTEYTVSGNYYVFEFNNISAKRLTETITATLYAEYNDVLCASKPIDYTIAGYCYQVLEFYNAEDYPAYSELRTLTVDLLNYGTKAQLYTDHNLDNLANAKLTDEQKAWGTSTEPTIESVLNAKYATVDNPTVTWSTAGLDLKESVEMRFKIATDSIDGLTFKVTTDSGAEWTIPAEKFEATSGGYYVYFSGLNATQMRTPVYLTVYNGDTAVSNTLRYSIESYAYQAVGSTDTELVELAKAMMVYCDSARAYVS